MTTRFLFVFLVALPTLCRGITLSSSDGVIGFTGLRSSGGLSDPFTVNVKAPPFNAVGNGVVDDQPAIQAAINYAVGTNNTRSDLNRTVLIPPGRYNLGSALTLTNVRSCKITGSGRSSTILISSYPGPAVKTDGLWYSHISGIRFDGSVGHTNGVFELDGNVLKDGSTIGVQGNTFSDCMFNGNSVVAYGMAIVSQGGSYGQGSENLFLNCHWQSCTNAGVVMAGANALQNTFIGGNMQNCRNHGFYIRYGSACIYSMGFQNAVNGVLLQTGYDIKIESFVNAVNLIQGCRSESLRYINSGAAPVDVVGWYGHPGVPSWAANTTYTTNSIIRDTDNAYLYRCSTAGTSGPTRPVWNPRVFNTDGTIVWETYDVIGVDVGRGNLRNSAFDYVFARLGWSAMMENCGFTRADWIYPNTYWDSSGHPGPTLIGNYSTYPYRLAPNSSAAATVRSDTQMNFGRAPLLFSAGIAGNSWGDVGLMRNDGTDLAPGDYSDSKNTLGVIGSLGKPVSTNSQGDDFTLIGGLGASAGGAIRLMTQATGATGAVTRVTVANDGLVSIGNAIAPGSTNRWQLKGVDTTGGTTNIVVNINGQDFWLQGAPH